jgi:hypothetical protein
MKPKLLCIAGAAQTEGYTIQARQTTGQELGAPSGRLRVADMVPTSDARADAAAASSAGAEDHRASSNQGVPDRCSAISGVRRRPDSARAETAQPGYRVLGVNPRAG